MERLARSAIIRRIKELSSRDVRSTSFLELEFCSLEWGHRPRCGPIIVDEALHPEAGVLDGRYVLPADRLGL